MECREHFIWGWSINTFVKPKNIHQSNDNSPPPPTNVDNRTLYICDNLRVMRGINSNSIDLIATDPPFNSKRIYNAPLESRSAQQRFDDRWRWDDITDDWYDVLSTDQVIKELIEAAVVIEGGNIKGYTIDTGRIQNSIAAFLAWMAPRLIEMHRILKPTGSIFLHCDPSANAYLRLLMDAIFGRKNFHNEVVWCYKSGGASKRRFAKKHDIILFYGKNEKQTLFNPIKVKSYGETGGGQGGAVKYYRDKRGTYSIVNARDWWEISMLSTTHPERTGWSTQKPLTLYERIINAASNEGDFVLDPFAGCATTCVAAEKLSRKWIGIDIDRQAEDITKKRLYETSGLVQHIDNEFVTVKKHPPTRKDIPKVKDDDIRELLWRRQGFKCFNGYCAITLEMKNVEIDHLIPKSRGGADEIENFIGLCGNCNRRKGVKSWGAFLDYERIRKALEQPHPAVPVVDVK